jgi:hypothetical protein
LHGGIDSYFVPKRQYLFQPELRYDPENDKIIYRGADNPLSRPTSRCILFDGENISFGASLVI